MRSLFIFICFFAIGFTSCKLENESPKPVTYHLSITSSHDDAKFLTIGNKQLNSFTTKKFEMDFEATKGDKIVISTGFDNEISKPDHSITLFVNKGPFPIVRETQKEIISISHVGVWN